MASSTSLYPDSVVLLKMYFLPLLVSLLLKKKKKTKRRNDDFEIFLNDLIGFYWHNQDKLCTDASNKNNQYWKTKYSK